MAQLDNRLPIEKISITDLNDVTITSADQYDLLQVNNAGEWVDVSNLDLGSNTITTTGTLTAGATTINGDLKVDTSSTTAFLVENGPGDTSVFTIDSATNKGGIGCELADIKAQFMVGTKANTQGTSCQSGTLMVWGASDPSAHNWCIKALDTNAAYTVGVGGGIAFGGAYADYRYNELGCGIKAYRESAAQYADDWGMSFYTSYNDNTMNRVMNLDKNGHLDMIAGGNISTGGFIRNDADDSKHTWGENGDTDSYIQFGGTNLEYYSSGAHAFEGDITGAGAITATTTVTGEHLTSTDDATITDILNVGGNVGIGSNAVPAYGIYQTFSSTVNNDTRYGKYMVVNATGGTTDWYDANTIVGEYVDLNISGDYDAWFGGSVNTGFDIDIDDTSVTNGLATSRITKGMNLRVTFMGTNADPGMHELVGAFILTEGNLGTTGVTRQTGIWAQASGTSDVNYGVYANTSGGDLNYAFYVAGGDTFLGNDNVKTWWGTGKDCSIHYDNQDLIITPDEVGDGRVVIEGDGFVNGLSIGFDRPSARFSIEGQGAPDTTDNATQNLWLDMWLEPAATITGTKNGLQNIIRWEGDQNVTGDVRVMNNLCNFLTASTSGTIAEWSNMDNRINQAADEFTGTITDFYMYRIVNNKMDATDINITNWHGFTHPAITFDGTSNVAIEIGNITGATTNHAIKTGTGLVLFGDKVAFTQTDGNEFIDSLNDGYMDYGATTAHRFDNYVTVAGSSAGQSIIASGLVVNEDSGGAATDDFRAETTSNANAFVVDASADEILAAVIMKANAGINTIVSTDDVTDPPTDAELDSAFGTPATLGAGFVGILDDNSADTDVWLCYTSDTSWFYLQGTKAT